MHKTIWPLLLLAACNEYDLAAEDDPNTGVDTGEVIIDENCQVGLAGPRAELDQECATSSTAPPVNPWSWTIEWQWLGGAVVSTPSVGDLDADGVPEVVVVAGTGNLTIFDGASGTVELALPGYDYQSGTALGDIDGDGYGEIVVTTGSCFSAHDVVVLEHDGTVKWSTATLGTTIASACETYPVIADLEGDGSIEIVVNEVIFDATTGSIERTLPGMSGDNWGAPAVADMDMDGVQEILLVNKVFGADGTLRMTCGLGGTGAFPHPVNIDADPQGEVLTAGNGGMTLCDDDGTVLWTRSYSSYGAPIAVADFDDDGVQEFAFAKNGSLDLIEGDNTVRWSTPIADFSGLAGTTSWDVDLDGVPEVVYADENDILVMNGSTGAVVLREGSHGSWTAAETPAVADVDGDGNGELVYGSNSGITGITVVGGADGDWPYAKPVYNQYTYYGANVGSDLSIPTSPPAPWLQPANLFRGQPSAVYTSSQPNLRAAITDVCITACETGSAMIAIQVWNDGSSPTPAGTTVEVYGLVDGLEFMVWDAAMPSIAPQASWQWSLELPMTSVGTQLRIAVDSAGAVDECREGDNGALWTNIPC